MVMDGWAGLEMEWESRAGIGKSHLMMGIVGTSRTGKSTYE